MIMIIVLIVLCWKTNYICIGNMEWGVGALRGAFISYDNDDEMVMIRDDSDDVSAYDNGEE